MPLAVATTTELEPGQKVEFVSPETRMTALEFHGPTTGCQEDPKSVDRYMADPRELLVLVTVPATKR